MTRYAFPSASTAFIMAVLLLATCSCAGGGQGEAPKPPSEPLSQAQTTGIPETLPSAQSPAPAVPSSPPLQPDNPAASDAIQDVSGEVVITFGYERQSGSASNQFAVWIEDISGNVVQTLYATRWTANGGYKSRPDSIALWVEKSRLASMPKSEVDAISGATPKTGTQSYTWDLRGAGGEQVPPGEYMFFVEGTLRWKNAVLYSGVITLGGAPATVEADAKFIYEASGGNAALTADAPENGMIGAVTANFTPSSGG